MSTPAVAGDGPRIPHVQALDGLRGAAVVAVLLFHAGHLDGGYLGVDLFFVLSGFLITSLLLAERDGTGGVRLGAFWARRARRLLPALFLVLLGVGAYAAFVARPTELDRIRGDALATLGYVANWHAISAGHDYWGLFSAPSPLEHTWSLAIEEQFYLVWPLVFVGLGALTTRRRSLAPRVLAVALGGAAVLGGLAIVLSASGADSTREYLGTDARAPAVLLGAALAALLAWRGTASSRHGRVVVELLGCVGVAWLVWAWTSLGGQDPLLLRGGLLISGVAAVAVLAAAAQPVRGPIGAALSVAPLCWLGLVSYGLYLWHWPVYVWLDPARTGLDGWGLTATRVAVSLAFAIASYFLVEMPIRRGALRGRPIRFLAPAAVAVTVVVVLVATIGGATRPTTAQTIAAGRHLLSSTPPPQQPAAPSILVVGDSVAWSIGEQLDDVAQARGGASYNAGVIGCQIPRSERVIPLFRLEPSDTPPACREWPTRWAVQLAQVHPNHVLLTVGFPAAEDIELHGALHRVCSTWWRGFFRSEFVGALDVLGSTGAEVSVANIVRPAAGYPLHLGPAVSCMNRLLRQAVAEASVRATLIDLDRFVCPHGQCRDDIDGQPLRPDAAHFEGPGGAAVAAWLLEQITAPSPSAPAGPGGDRTMSR